MRLLFATSELAGLSSTGGLGEVAAGLVSALRASGLDVILATPDYGDVELAAERRDPLVVPAWAGDCLVRSGRHALVGDVDLISLPGMARPHPYVDPRSGEGWHDNDQRFFAFSAAVAALARERAVDIIHLNDWHTAAALGYLAGEIPSVLSLHNLAHQGWADGGWQENLGPRAAAYKVLGSVNALAGGINLADRIVAVSPTFAQEILTDTGGMGLADYLLKRVDVVSGIVNGIDTAVWNPQSDRSIAAHYSADSPADKAECKRLLCRELGLNPALPLAIMVARLDHQKGADLLGHVVPLLAGIPVQIAVLGIGDRGLEDHIGWLARSNPGQVTFNCAFDTELSHRMFAGGDFALIPSRFEPCGLTQMQAMLYGTIPIATAVGGLRDTIVDADRDRQDGTGIMMAHAAPPDLVDGLHRAVRLYRDEQRHRAVQLRGMNTDWSWAGPAARYIELYESLHR